MDEFQLTLIFLVFVVALVAILAIVVIVRSDEKGKKPNPKSRLSPEQEEAAKQVMDE